MPFSLLLTIWPLSRVMTLAPLLRVDTLVTGAETAAGMVLGDLEYAYNGHKTTKTTTAPTDRRTHTKKRKGRENVESSMQQESREGSINQFIWSNLPFDRKQESALLLHKTTHDRGHKTSQVHTRMIRQKHLFHESYSKESDGGYMLVYK